MFFFTNEKDSIKIQPNSIEHAYLAILDNNLSVAKKIFESIDSPRANWGSILVDIIKGFIKKQPSYFEIRNFLEIDLDFLIKNEKLNYVENILGATDILINTNQETYKYIARVMFENNLYQVSKKYLDKSKKIFYNDPELHYMITKYFLKMNDLISANYYIDECLKILPNYYPAIEIKAQINNNLES